MDFTWVNLFQLIDQMWGLSQNVIAEYLGCNRSTISKLTSGKQKKFSKSSNEIFNNLFDPTNERLLHVCKRDKKSLLKRLVEEIEAMGLAEAIENIEHDEYISFVLGLIRLAKKSQPPKIPRNKATTYVSTDDTKNTKIDSQNDEPQSEVLSEIFSQSDQDFDIKGFIDSNPVGTFPIRFREDVKHFIARIRYSQEHKDILDKDEVIYKDINSFVDLLSEYHEYLCKHMREYCIPDDSGPNSYRVLYELPENDNGEFEEETKRYRRELKSLYNEICNSNT